MKNNPKDSLMELCAEKNKKNRIEKLAQQIQPYDDLHYINTRLPKKLIKRIKIYCAENDLHIQEFMFDAVQRRLQLKK